MRIQTSMGVMVIRSVVDWIVNVTINNTFRNYFVAQNEKQGYWQVGFFQDNKYTWLDVEKKRQDAVEHIMCRYAPHLMNKGFQVELA